MLPFSGSFRSIRIRLAAAFTLVVALLLIAADIGLVEERVLAREFLVTATSASHVDILTRNLLDNAVCYTPIGKMVRLQIQTVPGRAVRLEITNEELPLLAGKEARFGEAFYRPDPSRSAETGGNGLGLPICQALANLNGWNLSLHQDEEGFHATTVFPLLPPFAEAAA